LSPAARAAAGAFRGDTLAGPAPLA